MSPLSVNGRTAATAALPRRSGVRFGLLFAGFGFVDFQHLSVDVATVEAGDCGARFVGIAELDEAEALRLAARLFGGDIRRDEFSIRNREIVELRIGDLFGEISYVNFHWCSWPG